LDFDYRNLDTPGGSILGGHGYLDFAGPDVPRGEIFERFTDDTQKLKAQGDPHGLPADNPQGDKKAGSITGSFVCDWYDSLNGSVAAIKGANINYGLLGPNSNSAARYMLSNLPTTFTPWFSVPSSLRGFYTKLPRLEK
jgi:hypothetical protein